MKSPIMKVRREAVSTVNFEGMNRLPPVNGLREVRGEIVPGTTASAGLPLRYGMSWQSVRA